MTIARELREYAETPDRYAPAIEGSSVTRFDNGRVCVIQGPTWASVSAPNVAADEVEALLAETRNLIPKANSRPGGSGRRRGRRMSSSDSNRSACNSRTIASRAWSRSFARRRPSR